MLIFHKYFVTFGCAALPDRRNCPAQYEHTIHRPLINQKTSSGHSKSSFGMTGVDEARADVAGLGFLTNPLTTAVEFSCTGGKILSVEVLKDPKGDLLPYTEGAKTFRSVSLAGEVVDLRADRLLPLFDGDRRGGASVGVTVAAIELSGFRAGKGGISGSSCSGEEAATTKRAFLGRSAGREDRLRFVATDGEVFDAFSFPSAWLSPSINDFLFLLNVLAQSDWASSLSSWAAASSVALGATLLWGVQGTWPSVNCSRHTNGS